MQEAEGGDSPMRGSVAIQGGPREASLKGISASNPDELREMDPEVTSGMGSW